ncbi:Insoluble matrix shell protein 1 [Scenedesmus sp. PABB004]|nr:Insoluble matrix shell protein 1 [Scenedesmus sp. PABB004]
MAGAIARPTRAALVLLALLAPAGALAAAPAWEPALWNRAVKYVANKVPAALLKQGTAMYDGGSASDGAYHEPLFPLMGYDVTRQCKGPNAKLDAAQAKPGACQYKPNKDGTFTYWEKQPGDWSRLSNCYCYALNTFKGGWCQPGAASGVPLEQHSMTCAQLTKAIVADGGRPVPRAAALSGSPGAGHFIAAMLRPQSACNFARCQPDFHFLRKDANGLWSQKAGESPATNLDAQGQPIRDPQAAKLQGSYTQFCGYFAVEPSKMKVGTIAVPNLISRGLAKWKASGLAVSVEPLAYNAAVDAADAATDYAMLQQQQFALQRAGGRRLLAAAAAGSS